MHKTLSTAKKILSNVRNQTRPSRFTIRVKLPLLSSISTVTLSTFQHIIKKRFTWVIYIKMNLYLNRKSTLLRLF